MIIGLIVGGVLVGRDLIRQATLRKVLTEVGMYNQAVNTFRLKYNALPGDMPYADAAQVFTLPNDDSYGGNGNGMIVQNWETYIFWFHLGKSELIAFKPPYALWDSSAGSDAYNYNNDIAGITIPKSVLSDKAGWKAITSGNWWTEVIQNNRFILATQGGGVNFGSYRHEGGAMTPADAYALDVKIDDGVPSCNPFTNNTDAGSIPDACASKKLNVNNGRTLDADAVQDCYTYNGSVYAYSVRNGDTACAVSFLIGQ